MNAAVSIEPLERCAHPHDAEALHAANVSRGRAAWLSELFAFRAPYLEAKLVKEKILATPEEGAAYLTELKKYFVLVTANPALNMESRLVDEVWHQFVLFTREYTEFCDRYFGLYLHHVPFVPEEETPTARASDGPSASSEAPTAASRTDDAHPPSEARATGPDRATREDFVDAYEAAFGPLPSLWNDAERAGPRTRIFRDPNVPLEVRSEAGKVELFAQVRGRPRLLLRMDASGEPALRFVLEEDVFLVRELPGLAPADRVRFARALLKRGKLFRIGP